MIKRIKELKKGKKRNLKRWEDLSRKEKDEILKKMAKKLGLVL